MMDGGDGERIDWEAETFLARISHRLERLYNILQTNRCKAEKEKNELQSLLSDISHQIKVPIANLKMVNETLSTRQVSAEKQREFLQISKSQLDKLDFLIQAMIKTSRLETGMLIFEKKSASLADTLSTALNGVLASMEKKQIDWSVDCPENIAFLHDSRWTAEALYNLLDNAVKYTSVGGSIQVEV